LIIFPAVEIGDEPKPTISERLSVALGSTRLALGSAWNSAKQGYANLPEWLQPVVWGFVLATPFSLAIVIWQIVR
jgi:hypothetical protein